MAKVNKEFSVSPQEFYAKWSKHFREVFHIPEDVPNSKHIDWPIFPDPVFRDQYSLAFLDSELIFLNSDIFKQFLRFIRNVGEDEFAILLTPYPDNEGIYCYSFSSDIDWNIFSDKPMGGNLSVVSTSYPYFVTGTTERWGLYYPLKWEVPIVGYVDMEVLEAIQGVFYIEGRNIRRIKSMFSDIERIEEMYDELSVEQAYRFREIAEESNR